LIFLLCPKDQNLKVAKLFIQMGFKSHSGQQRKKLANEMEDRNELLSIFLGPVSG
jgi:predicted nuclease of restriction endonuclease-like RecB superfamily